MYVLNRRVYIFILENLSIEVTIGSRVWQGTPVHGRRWVLIPNTFPSPSNFPPRGY